MTYWDYQVPLPENPHVKECSLPAWIAKAVCMRICTISVGRVAKVPWLACQGSSWKCWVGASGKQPLQIQGETQNAMMQSSHISVPLSFHLPTHPGPSHPLWLHMLLRTGDCSFSISSPLHWAPDYTAHPRDTTHTVAKLRSLLPLPAPVSVPGLPNLENGSTCSIPMSYQCLCSSSLYHHSSQGSSSSLLIHNLPQLLDALPSSLQSAFNIAAPTLISRSLTLLKASVVPCYLQDKIHTSYYDT